VSWEENTLTVKCAGRTKNHLKDPWNAPGRGMGRGESVQKVSLAHRGRGEVGWETTGKDRDAGVLSGLSASFRQEMHIL